MKVKEAEEMIRVRISTVMRQKRITPSILARKTGISESVIRGYIQEGVVPTAGRLAVICEALKLDIAWVCGLRAGAPTLTQPNEWVSVYDQLPEPGERVLATDCGFVGEFYINKRGKWQRYNVNCSELLMALDILYWMPLPAPPDCRPPEGEEEENDVIEITENL